MHRRHWGIGLTSLLALGALAWCFVSPSQVVPALPEPEPEPEPELAALELTPTAAHSPRERAVSPPATPPIAPAEHADDERIGMPSHPLTPKHQRIFRENNVIGDLNGAMDIADVGGLRKLLQQYRAEYPEDAHVLQDGYELIANCLERPGSETRAVAQRYYDEERASGLRRYIRRHCLEAPGSN